MTTLRPRDRLDAHLDGPIAETDGLCFTYPDGTHALDGIDLALPGGTLVQLRGDSGTGKTTLLRALSGLIPHFHGGQMAGRVTIGGRDTRRSRPEVLGRHAGILFQEPERQAVHRSVLRDVAFGPGNVGVAPTRLRSRVEEALADVGAGHLIDRRLDELSGGERQRVALAGVIAAGQPLVLLDEPTSQIDDAGERQLAEAIVALRESGRTIVVSGHGGTPGDAVPDLSVDLPHTGASAEHPIAFPVPAGRLVTASGLEIRRGRRVVIDGLDVVLGQGEVRALTGPNGGGKTSLLMGISGLLPLDAGSVRLGSQVVSDRPLPERFPETAMVPQDPRLYFLTQSVEEEVAFSVRRRAAGVRSARTAAALHQFDLDGLEQRHPLDLSSGQAQRVALAAAFAQEPKVLLLDEPTRGLDVRSRQLLVAALAAHAHRGGAALVATHDPVLAAALPGDPLDLPRRGR